MSIEARKLMTPNHPLDTRLSPNDEEKYAAWSARYFANVTTSIISHAFRQAAQADSSDKGGAAALKY